jgi:hypothetical protein
VPPPSSLPAAGAEAVGARVGGTVLPGFGEASLARLPGTTWSGLERSTRTTSARASGMKPSSSRRCAGRQISLTDDGRAVTRRCPTIASEFAASIRSASAYRARAVVRSSASSAASACATATDALPLASPTSARPSFAQSPASARCASA